MYVSPIVNFRENLHVLDEPPFERLPPTDIGFGVMIPLFMVLDAVTMGEWRGLIDHACG